MDWTLGDARSLFVASSSAVGTREPIGPFVPPVAAPANLWPFLPRELTSVLLALDRALLALCDPAALRSLVNVEVMQPDVLPAASALFLRGGVPRTIEA